MKLNKEQVEVIEIALVARIAILNEAFVHNDDPFILEDLELAKSTLEEVREFYR